MSDVEGLMKFYATAIGYCQNKFPEEVEWARRVKFANQTSTTFFRQYVWVVLCSGFKAAVAQKIIERVFYGGFHPEAIRHFRKRKAVEQAWKEFPAWFTTLRLLPDDMRIAYLDSLPYIGKVTKYHLARNLGLDFCKPDVHLERLAKRFGFQDVHIMCGSISQRTGDRIGLVDVALWRYCEQGRPLETL